MPVGLHAEFPTIKHTLVRVCVRACVCVCVCVYVYVCCTPSPQLASVFFLFTYKRPFASIEHSLSG